MQALHAQVEPWVRPAASPEAVTRCLELMGNLFQVTTPTPEGQAIYIAILGELSEAMLKQAMVEVCKTHKYKTMPLPADLLEAVKDDLWQWQWADKTLRDIIAKLEPA